MSENSDSLHNGFLCDCPEFAIFLERWFEKTHTHEDDRWWVRDWLSCAWDAAVDATRGISLDLDQRRARAMRLDDVALAEYRKES